MNNKKSLFQSVIVLWGESHYARHACIGWIFFRWRKEYPAKKIEMVWQRWQRARHTQLLPTRPIALNTQTVLLMRESFWQTVAKPFIGTPKASSPSSMTGFQPSVDRLVERLQHTQLLTRLILHPANRVSILSKLAQVNYTHIANFHTIKQESNSTTLPFVHRVRNDNRGPAIVFADSSYPMPHAPSSVMRAAPLPILNQKLMSAFSSSYNPRLQARISSRFNSFTETTVQASRPYGEANAVREFIARSSLSLSVATSAGLRLSPSVASLPQSSATVPIPTTIRTESLPLYSRTLSADGVSHTQQSNALLSKPTRLEIKAKAAHFPVHTDITPRNFRTSGHVTALRQVAAEGSVVSGATLTSPFAVRHSSPKRDVHLLYLKPVEKPSDFGQLQENVTRKVEESLEKKVAAKVKTAVARELSAESVFGRRLTERLINNLYGDLAFEKERLGLG